MEQEIKKAISIAVPIVKHFEGCRLSPYHCSAKVPTIGYGATRYPNGKRVSINDPDITQKEAEDFLEHDLQKFAYGVLRLIKVKLEPQEHAALISFSYNLGLGNLQNSTLRMKLNRNERLGAANELPKWVLAGGRKLRGLVVRRRSERELFLS
jgi:lysozyme|tara:strand:- start:4474 stop:4932 length:459 start_codon:yes stop_codon:yes gene_type:complete